MYDPQYCKSYFFISSQTLNVNFAYAIARAQCTMSIFKNHFTYSHLLKFKINCSSILIYGPQLCYVDQNKKLRPSLQWNHDDTSAGDLKKCHK